VLGLDIRHAGPEARSNAHGGDEKPDPGHGQAAGDRAEDVAAAEAPAWLTPAGAQVDVLA